MPTIELRGNSDDLGWVLATMQFPDSLLQRQQYFAAKGIAGLISGCADSDRIAVSVEMLRLLILAPAPADLMEQSKSRTKSGLLAGNLLSALYVMDRFNLSPSMNRAIWVVQRYAEAGNRYGDGSDVPRSERKIRECWEMFRPVAHLWAAYQLSFEYHYAPSGELFAKEYFGRFLGVAAEMHRFGVSFIPSRARPAVPVMDAETSYALPDTIKPIDIVPAASPDQLIKFLADYKAPMPYR